MSEHIIDDLRKFVETTGRLPTNNEEPKHQLLVDLAISNFGSLENALIVAGLLTSENKRTTPLRKKFIKRETKTTTKSPIHTYPENFFLHFLGISLSRYQQGAPTWWERKSRTTYRCSTCNQNIRSGDRYIAKKVLNPGQKGIYGYRGTYSIDYYHIICLLNTAVRDLENSIYLLNDQISSIFSQIHQLEVETTIKKHEAKDCENTISQSLEIYQKSDGFLDKIKKWGSLKSTTWSKKKEIAQYKNRIIEIQNNEIPSRRTQLEKLQKEQEEKKESLEETKNIIALIS